MSYSFFSWLSFSFKLTVTIVMCCFIGSLKCTCQFYVVKAEFRVWTFFIYSYIGPAWTNNLYTTPVGSF